MNDSNEFPASGQADAFESQPAQAETVAFCQNCGRSLTRNAARTVGQAVFCEPCLVDRLAAGARQPPPPYAGGVMPDPAAAAWVQANAAAPNPGLATWLGFIPGVGAMYNEQYAKGIVHLIVFVILIAVTDSFGIFGIFIAGWEFYMAIDANHTARARRDGLPLPNPFGLNDIGERLGFGKAWPGNPSVPAAAQDAAQAASYEASQAVRDAAAYATHATSFPPQGYGTAPAYAAQTPGAYPPDAIPAWPSTPVPAPKPLSRFPAGAIWLIGLGSLFLLATTGLFDRIRTNAVVGVVLIALAVWIFVRRMTEGGEGLQGDGSPVYRFRVFRALRVPVWLAAVGLWLVLDAFRWMNLHHTWPLLLILAGVMTLMERLISNSLAAQAYGTPATMPPTTSSEAGPPLTPDEAAKGGL